MEPNVILARPASARSFASFVVNLRVLCGKYLTPRTRRHRDKGQEETRRSALLLRFAHKDGSEFLKKGIRCRRLHVCSSALVALTVERTGARSLVTLLKPDGTIVERPRAIAPERHLTLAISDIVAPIDGQTLAERAEIQNLLDFVRGWDRAEPMLIHCFAGVSRSTAAAFIAACALNSRRDEFDIALPLRAASPTATPNAHLVALADAALERGGRMTETRSQKSAGASCVSRGRRSRWSWGRGCST